MRERSRGSIGESARDVALARTAARRRFGHLSNDDGPPSGIADPENPPLSDDQLSAMRPAAEVHPGLVAVGLRRRAGRPKSQESKTAVSLRLDPDVVDALKRQGPGWQTQANALLRRALGLAVR